MFDAPMSLPAAPQVPGIELDWCPACDGAGEIEHYHSTWSKSPYWIETCEPCDGTGKVAADAVTDDSATEVA